MMIKFAAFVMTCLTILMLAPVHCKVIDPRSTRQHAQPKPGGAGGLPVSEQLLSDIPDVTAGINEMLTPEGNRINVDDREVTIDNDIETLCPKNDLACLRRQVRVEEFKMELLDKLNLKVPPNVSKDDLPSQFTVDSLRRRYGIDRAEMKAREDRLETREIITLSKSFSEEERGNGDRGCYFEFTEEERTYTAKRAILWMFVHADDNRAVPDFTFVRLLHYKQYSNGSVATGSGPRRRVRVTSNGGHWQPIDVKSYVNRWIDNQREERRMKVVAEDDSVLSIDVSDDFSPFKPYMQVTLMKDPSARSRSKRDYLSTENQCDGIHAHQHCCKFDLEINFHQVNWDWIIYPESYNARYCAGSCSYTHVRDSIRGKLVGMAARGLDGEAAKSCCTAESLDAISILYYDELRNIVFTNVDGMQIRSCHCA